MKKIILNICVVIFVGTFFTACNKCNTCTSEANNSHRYSEGDIVTVISGLVTYNAVDYKVGDSFTIASNDALFGGGLQFEGTGMGSLSTEICGSGTTYNNQLEQYKKNSWTCVKK